MPTVSAVKQVDTVEQCGKFEESFHLGPTGFQEVGDSGCHAQKVYATVQYKECAEGGHRGGQCRVIAGHSRPAGSGHRCGHSLPRPGHGFCHSGTDGYAGGAVPRRAGDPEQSIQASSVIVSAPFVAGPVERFVLYCLRHYYFCGNDKSNEFPCSSMNFNDCSKIV